MLEDVVVLEDSPRGVGEYVSAPTWVPPEATVVELLLGGRSTWHRLGARDDIVAAAIEINQAGQWCLLTGFTVDAAQPGDDAAIVLSSPLPTQRIPIPQVRCRLQHRSPAAGAVIMQFAAGPMPVVAPQEHHSVTFDAASTAKVTSATSLTFAHTCTGANRVLVAGSSTDAAVETTGVTYNAVALTAITGVSYSTFNRGELFGLIAPATGSNNIVITAASAVGIVGGGVSVTDADQTTGWHNPATASGLSTAPSVAVTSATGELVVDVVTNGVNAGSLPTASVGASQTQRWNDAVVDKMRGCGSTEPGAASVTMSWTLTASEGWSICGVAVMAAPAAGTSLPPVVSYFQHMLVR